MVSIPVEDLPPSFPYKYEKDTFVTCSCGSEAICVNEMFDDTELFLSFWQFGYHQGSMPFRTRLKYAWAALRGTPYFNEIILNKEQLDIFIACLQERAKNIKPAQE